MSRLHAIAAHLEGLPGVALRSVGIDDGERGLSPAILDFAEVLVWWGHVRHPDIKEDDGRAIVSRPQRWEAKPSPLAAT